MKWLRETRDRHYEETKDMTLGGAAAMAQDSVQRILVSRSSSTASMWWSPMRAAPGGSGPSGTKLDGAREPTVRSDDPKACARREGGVV